jgi:AcrR family transcriptional regulator
MEQQLDELPEQPDASATARARLRAVGTGYLRYAREQPGLFRTAFSVPGDMSDATSPELAGQSGRTAFQLLSAALDEMAAAGLLSAQRRPGAELLAWSAVHGLAALLIDGPLRALDGTIAGQVGQRLIDMVEHGLGAGC